MPPLRAAWHQFWRYQRIIVRETGWPPFRDWAVAFIAALLAGGVEQAVTGTWSWLLPVVAGVAAGLLLYLVDLARTSARRDEDHIRRMRLFAGDLTDDEIAQANRDRMALQRGAHRLFNCWIVFDNARLTGSEEEMLRGEKELERAARELRQLVLSTTHGRALAYDEALLPLEAVLRRRDLHPFNKGNLMIPPLEALSGLEHADRLWVLEHRTLRPPATGQPHPTAPAPAPPSSRE